MAEFWLSLGCSLKIQAQPSSAQASPFQPKKQFKGGMLRSAIFSQIQPKSGISAKAQPISAILSRTQPYSAKLQPKFPPAISSPNFAIFRLSCFSHIQPFSANFHHLNVWICLSMAEFLAVLSLMLATIDFLRTSEILSFFSATTYHKEILTIFQNVPKIWCWNAKISGDIWGGGYPHWLISDEKVSSGN